MLLMMASVSLLRAWPALKYPALWRTMVSGVILGCIGIAVWSWPHGICFTNQAWGGTREGYRVLADANYDWGQGLKELRQWQETSGEKGKNLRVWYFGTDPAVKSDPFQLAPLHTLKFTHPEEVMPHLEGGYFAVGTNILYSNPEFTPSARVALQVLKQHQPVARTTTFFIYDFRSPSQE
jgi:hypothetical protein